MPNTNVQEWRGFDPWWQYVDAGLYQVLVRTRFDGIENLLTLPQMGTTKVDLLTTGSLPSGISPDQMPIFIFQLREHDWTQLWCDRPEWIVHLPCLLSSALKTQVFVKIDKSEGYQIFENGSVVEEFCGGCDPDMFNWDGAMEEMAEEGWRISSDYYYMFRTKLGSELDLESKEECKGFLERTVRAMGMYVARPPWSYDNTTESIVFEPGWQPDYFSGASVLLRGKTPPGIKANLSEWTDSLLDVLGLPRDWSHNANSW